MKLSGGDIDKSGKHILGTSRDEDFRAYLETIGTNLKSVHVTCTGGVESDIGIWGQSSNADYYAVAKTNASLDSKSPIKAEVIVKASDMYKALESDIVALKEWENRVSLHRSKYAPESFIVKKNLGRGKKQYPSFHYNQTSVRWYNDVYLPPIDRDFPNKDDPKTKSVQIPKWIYDDEINEFVKVDSSQGGFRDLNALNKAFQGQTVYTENNLVEWQKIQNEELQYYRDLLAIENLEYERSVQFEEEYIRKEGERKRIEEERRHRSRTH